MYFLRSFQIHNSNLFFCDLIETCRFFSVFNQSQVEELKIQSYSICYTHIIKSNVKRIVTHLGDS